MIGHLEGQIRAVKIGWCLIDVHGVGYKVSATKETLSRMRADASISLWTHLAVREDALDLYGFPREEELHLFEQLLTVSGIGPKSALAVLDIASVETLRSAIATGNATYLVNVSGIGKKTAEKIVLELKDKVGIGSDGATNALSGDAEALEAMRSLGYSAQEARDAMRKVPPTIESGSERLREALRLLGK